MVTWYNKQGLGLLHVFINQLGYDIFLTINIQQMYLHNLCKKTIPRAGEKKTCPRVLLIHWKFENIKYFKQVPQAV
jgi:hypothetical protein